MPDRDFLPAEGEWFYFMNQFAEALYTSDLSAGEYKFLMFLMRRAWGFRESSANLHWKFIKEKTGLADSTLSRSISSLKSHNIVNTSTNGSKTYVTYKINSKISTWKSKIKKKNTSAGGSKTLPPAEVHPLKTYIKTKRRTDQKIMDREILNDGSVKKIVADTDIVCQKLYEEGIFPKAHAFRNAMMKKNKNERAILHALSRCYLKKKFKEGGPWAYCVKIIKVENGNYNERDYNKT